MIDLDEIPMIGNKPMYYRLDEEHNVVPATRGEGIALLEGDPIERRVGYDEIGDQGVSTIFRQRVSTVFLVIDHSFGDGPPVVFETMIFGGRHEGQQWRYVTWDQAADGHREIVEALRNGTELP